MIFQCQFVLVVWMLFILSVTVTVTVSSWLKNHRVKGSCRWVISPDRFSFRIVLCYEACYKTCLLWLFNELSCEGDNVHHLIINILTLARLFYCYFNSIWTIFAQAWLANCSISGFHEKKLIFLYIMLLANCRSEDDLGDLLVGFTTFLSLVQLAYYCSRMWAFLGLQEKFNLLWGKY